MTANCIFCKIATGDSPGDIVYRDDLVTAFRDQHPAAPVHLLVIPNQHIASLNDATDGDQALLGHMLLVASRLAEQQGIQQDGYRIMINTGANAGQTVFHLHLHLLGGQRLRGFERK
jgi:histidine triad (HIT) family protein